MSEESFEESTGEKPKSKRTAFLLWFFLGLVGGHKFYLGKTGMGVAYMFTMGFLGIGWIMDIFTLSAQVDVANGIGSQEDAGIMAGLEKMQSGMQKFHAFSKKFQGIVGAPGADESELVICKYCGQKHRNVMVFTSSHYSCSRSPTGRHVPK
ncbi:MAG: TM2 domain-containing protein [Treponema sp.]|jgi:TM2 domain-containing membrane protein YozV|nr:TM2 domain-containing protein [Treponema sp.]